jgi:hypothetical protein
MEPPATGASSAFEPSPEMERFLCERLLDVKQPIAERFRALFSLRNLRGDAPRRALLQGLASPHLSYSPLVLCYSSKLDALYDRAVGTEVAVELNEFIANQCFIRNSLFVELSLLDQYSSGCGNYQPIS